MSAVRCWNKIEAKLSGITKDAISVPSAVIEEIDAVMEQYGPEAHKDHPGDTDDARAGRVNFWYKKYLAQFSDRVAKARAAKLFIQVMTSYIRGERAPAYTHFTIDEHGCVNPAA